MKLKFVMIGFLVWTVRSARIDRVEKRLRVLEDKVYVDSSAFRDDFELVFDILNKSESRTEGKSAPCCKQSSADGDMPAEFFSFKADVSRDVAAMRHGLSTEKKVIRRDIELVEGRVETVTRQVNNTIKYMEGEIERVARSVQTRDGIQDYLQNKLNDISQEIKKELINFKEDIFHQMNVMNSWKWHGSSYYLFPSEKVTWHEAIERCREFGGYVVEINSETENDFLIGIINYNPDRYSDVGFWLGGSDVEEEGVWKWSHSGKLVMDGYQFWIKNQPDNYKDAEDCLHVWIKHGLKWNDFPCGLKINYICEKDVFFTSQ